MIHGRLTRRPTRSRFGTHWTFSSSPGLPDSFPDAERLVKRRVAQELILSFVPDPEQRLWRTVTRRKLQMTRLRVRMQNQLESLLEEAHIKLSGLVADLLGLSSRRMLQALAVSSARLSGRF